MDRPFRLVLNANPRSINNTLGSICSTVKRDRRSGRGVVGNGARRGGGMVHSPHGDLESVTLAWPQD
jgi:hypothetical protein